MKRARTICLLLLCLTLTGCGGGLLERSYSSVTPHSAAYRVGEDEDTLRAENYQELVNALLILLGEHSEDGTVRLYGEYPNPMALAGDACVEVQQETALGAYLLDYITYNGAAESGYFELTVHFSYRRTAEEQASLVNATGPEALPDLLRAAVDEGRDVVAIRFGYFGADGANVLELISAVHDEFYPPEETAATPDGEAAETAQAIEASVEDGAESAPPEAADPSGAVEALAVEPAPLPDLSPWQVLLYPDSEQPGIVEVLLHAADE